MAMKIKSKSKQTDTINTMLQTQINLDSLTGS